MRVAVSAAAVNFGDIARCRGGVASVMAQPPFTLGMDVCGVVDAAGEGAEQWIGRRVVAIELWRVFNLPVLNIPLQKCRGMI